MNVLVLGLARTGTTVVSGAIARTVGAKRYVSEPKSLQELDTAALARSGGVMVKLLFEHWHRQPNLRRGFVHNETELQFDRRVFLLRDPRDELISRMHFLIKPLIDSQAIDSKVVSRWLEVFRRKEAAPAEMPVFRMMHELESLLGGLQLGDLGTGRGYYQFVFRTKADRHLLKYEDFIAGTTTELEHYIGKGPLVRTFGSKYEHRLRTGTFDNWKSYFTPEDVEHYRSRFGSMLDRIGYHDWALAPCAKLDPATGSNYIEMLIQRAMRTHKWRLRALLPVRQRPGS